MSHIARSPARLAQNPLEVVVCHWLEATLNVLAAFNAGHSVPSLRCLRGELGAIGFAVGNLALGSGIQRFGPQSSQIVVPKLA